MDQSWRKRETISKQTFFFVFSESTDEKIAKCLDDAHCIKNRDFLKVRVFGLINPIDLVLFCLG